VEQCDPSSTWVIHTELYVTPTTCIIWTAASTVTTVRLIYILAEWQLCGSHYTLRCVVRCNYRWKVNGPCSTRQRRRCAHLWKKTVLPPKTTVFTPLIQTYGQLTVQYASQNLTHQVAPGRQRQAASWLPACWPGHVSQRTDRVLSSPRRVQWIATSHTEHHTADNCDGLHTYLFCFFPVI